MARHRPGCETIPVVPGPPELVDEGPEGESGVGRAAGDDDVGAGAERLGDRPGPEIGVGGDDAIADGAEGPTVVQVRQGDPRRQQLIQAREQVVAADDAERGRHALRPARLGDPIAAGGDVHASRIRHHPDPALHQDRQEGTQHLHEVVGVPEVGVPCPLPLEDHHGDLGEEVEGHVVDGIAANPAGEGLGIVPPVAARVGNPHHLPHPTNRMPSARSPARRRARPGGRYGYPGARGLPPDPHPPAPGTQLSTTLGHPPCCATARRGDAAGRRAPPTSGWPT